MQEMNEQEVLSLMTFQHEGSAVFLYTPMCGTCMAARRMLEVLQEMDPNLPLYSCNINSAPRLAQSWKIESIPCIVFIKEGKINEKMYAVQSVPVLFEKFTHYGLMTAGR